MAGMFLFPMYLLGGIALSLPVWVHLRNRQMARPYRFATLRFLVEAKLVSHRLRQLMRWLVLLLRLTAFAALVLAFAQPLLRATPLASGEASVLIIDVSASMQAGDAWREGKAAALKWLDGQSAQTRTAIVTIGRSAKVICGFSAPPAEKRAAIESLAPTCEGTDADGAIRLAGRLLSEHAASSKRVTIVSDLAGPAWRTVDWGTPLAPGITVDARPIAPQPSPNLAIVEVRTPRSFWSAQAALPVTALVQNDQIEPRKVTVDCFVGDTRSATKSVVVRGKGVAEVSFSIPPKDLSTLRGYIALRESDGFSIDNRRYFAIRPRQATRVGRIGAPDSGADVFLRTAIEPEADSASNRYRWVSIDPKLNGSLSQSVDVLLLDQGVALQRPLSQAVRTFLNDGGAAIVFLGDADAPAGWEKDWLPLSLGALRQVGGGDEPQHFAQVNFRHPILQPFAEPHGGDLFSVGVMRWRQFSCTSAQPLITLANGDGLVSLVSVGKARLAVFAMPAERAWSDWPIQSTFLPVLHQTLKWLQGSQSAGQGLLVGDAWTDGAVMIAPGFYGHEDSPDGLVAVNLDARESDLSRWTALGTFKQLESSSREVETPRAALLANSESGRKLVQWLLLGAALFSISELLLANRTPR